MYYGQVIVRSYQDPNRIVLSKKIKFGTRFHIYYNKQFGMFKFELSIEHWLGIIN